MIPRCLGRYSMCEEETVKLSCQRIGTTFNLSSILENGVVERITYDWGRDVAIEMIMAPKIDGPIEPKTMKKLREFLSFVKKTCSQDSISVNKWSDGGMILESGVIHPKNPLTVVGKGMAYAYENVESLLLDGWR